MQFIPYLNFDGNCAEAMAFYAKLFGGQVAHQMTFGEMPAGENMPPLPDSAKSRIMHAHLQIGEQALMASDAMPSTPGAAENCGGGYVKPQGLWVSIGVESAAEGQRIFDALAQGGTVAMPYAATFWSPGFGMVTDRFGTPWMLNTQE
ncbi:VOC family protein [Acidovorax sp. Be4]|uniref:VOC family protein n=1 Tax=Acidovorax bellezanensis TaxID=2976702 RepID=A0ABT2PID5_9BURK|nr:VOC family protein [Acidovorax sp. Be4]MCT9810235.1 VOC family protein [Acidovorax sp. Be4]